METIENIKLIKSAPGVKMCPIPDDLYDFRDLDEQKIENLDPDKKY